ADPPEQIGSSPAPTSPPAPLPHTGISPTCSLSLRDAPPCNLGLPASRSSRRCPPPRARLQGLQERSRQGSLPADGAPSFTGAPLPAGSDPLQPNSGLDRLCSGQRRRASSADGDGVAFRAAPSPCESA
uniref:Uncharacterized protein n=1 Tax=Aegilops tauschii subsp. strangulata TaxID=200361 RepID=A0A452XSK3_AEGTS